MKIPYYAHITLTRNEKFVLMRWIMGNSFSLIAQEMGVSRQRVHQLYRSGIDKLIKTANEDPGVGNI